MKLGELSPQTIATIKKYRWDRFIEKHEGPDDWESTLKWHSSEFMSINGYAVLLPVDFEQHSQITILRCIVSRDENVLTLFLKDMTYVHDPDETLFGGFVAICEKVKGETFYLAIFYHEWYPIENP